MLPVTAATTAFVPGLLPTIPEYGNGKRGKPCRKNFMRIARKICAHSVRILCLSVISPRQEQIQRKDTRRGRQYTLPYY